MYMLLLFCSDLKAEGGVGQEEVTPLIEEVKLPEVGHGPPPRQTEFFLVSPSPLEKKVMELELHILLLYYM